VEEAQREERARLGPAERKLAVTVERLERSHDPDANLAAGRARWLMQL
jgi:hypothetical protein